MKTFEVKTADGLQFVTATTWELDMRGHLLFRDEDGKVFKAYHDGYWLTVTDNIENEDDE